ARFAFSKTFNQGDALPLTTGARRSSAIARSLRIAAATYCDSRRCAGGFAATSSMKRSRSAGDKDEGGRSRDGLPSSGIRFDEAANHQTGLILLERISVECKF